MQCPLCRSRPARRLCPAKNIRICPVCCGSLRQREIDCPAGCPYLASAQAHPPAALRRQQQQDSVVAAMLTEGLNEQQASLCMALLSVVAGFRPDQLFRLQDDDLAEAARALAATLETASRGVIYEQRPQSLAGHRLYTAFRELLGRMGLEGSRRLEQDAALALRRVEVAAREVGKATATGPAACVEAIGRLVREAEAQQQSAAGPGTAAAAPGASLLIAP